MIGARRSGRLGEGVGQIEEVSAMVLRDRVVGANQIQRLLVGAFVAFLLKLAYERAERLSLFLAYPVNALTHNM